MIWPGMIFNLCLGLLTVAYLLRVLRRYEACVDAIIAKLDKDQEMSLRKFEVARDEIRASMRTETDRSIAMMQVTIEQFQAMVDSGNLESVNTETVPHKVGSSTDSSSVRLNGSTDSKSASIDNVS
jgi:hypothetical protein